MWVLGCGRVGVGARVWVLGCGRVGREVGGAGCGMGRARDGAGWIGDGRRRMCANRLPGLPHPEIGLPARV